MALQRLRELQVKTPIAWPDDLTEFMNIVAKNADDERLGWDIERTSLVFLNVFVKIVLDNIPTDLSKEAQLALVDRVYPEVFKSAPVLAKVTDYPELLQYIQPDQLLREAQRLVRRRFAAPSPFYEPDKRPQLVNKIDQSVLRRSCESVYFTKASPFASGKFGMVWEACLKPDLAVCPYVLRVEQLTLIENIKNLEVSLKNTKLAGDNGIGPKLIDAWLCDNVAKNIKQLFGTEYVYYKGNEDVKWFLFQVMQKLRGKTLKDLIDEKISIPREVWSNLYEKITKMHDLGIQHVDLHPGNVIVDLTTNDVFIIDYGSSSYQSEPLSQEQRAEDWSVLRQYWPTE